MTYAVAIYAEPWTIRKTGVQVPGLRPEVQHLSGAELAHLLTSFEVFPALQWVCSKRCGGTRHGRVEEKPCPACGLPMTRNKLETPMWAPHTLEPVHRKRSNVVSVSCLVFDYDNGTSIEGAHEAWKTFHHIIHTTWSHTVDHPKFRLVLPLAEPLPRAWFERAWHWGARRGDVDGQAKDPSRVYGLPAVRSETWPTYARVHAGQRQLDLRPFDELPLTPAERRRKEIAERPSKERTAPVRSVQREARHRLKRDPELRMVAAERLGMKVSGNYAQGGTCPEHGEGNVWFYIDPTGHTAKAWCNHRNSCAYGTTGAHIDELLLEHA